MAACAPSWRRAGPSRTPRSIFSRGSSWSAARRDRCRFIDTLTGVEPFRRDRLTWLAYAMLGWFAYLQAAPGLIVPHLRDELHLSYSTGGLHVAAWAGGSVIAGLVT